MVRQRSPDGPARPRTATRPIGPAAFQRVVPCSRGSAAARRTGTGAVNDPAPGRRTRGDARGPPWPSSRETRGKARPRLLAEVAARVERVDRLRAQGFEPERNVPLAAAGELLRRLAPLEPAAASPDPERLRLIHRADPHLRASRAGDGRARADPPHARRRPVGRRPQRRVCVSTSCGPPPALRSRCSSSSRAGTPRRSPPSRKRPVMSSTTTPSPRSRSNHSIEDAGLSLLRGGRSRPAVRRGHRGLAPRGRIAVLVARARLRDRPARPRCRGNTASGPH